ETTMETNGIKIQKQTFESLIKDYIEKIENENFSFSQNDYLTLTRIWNTINVKQLQNSSAQYSEFMKLFFPKIFRTATTELNATLTKGMAFYSDEFDLWFGGKLNDNSFFSFE